MSATRYVTRMGDTVHYVGPDGACHAAIVVGWDQHGDEPTSARLHLVEPGTLLLPDRAVPTETHDLTGVRPPTPGTCHHPARCERGIAL